MESPTCHWQLAARWSARVLSAGLVGLVGVIFVGEGGVNPLGLRPIEALLLFLLFACCIAMVAAWRWEWMGGALSLAAAAAFIGIEFAVSGHLVGGIVFYLLLLPGALFLASAWRRSRQLGPLGPENGTPRSA